MTIIAKLSFNKHLSTYSRKQGFLKDSQNYLTGENQKKTEISNYFTHCPLTWMILEKKLNNQVIRFSKKYQKTYFWYYTNYENNFYVCFTVETCLPLVDFSYPLLASHFSHVNFIRERDYFHTKNRNYCGAVINQSGYIGFLEPKKNFFIALGFVE